MASPRMNGWNVDMSPNRRGIGGVGAGEGSFDPNRNQFRASNNNTNTNTNSTYNNKFNFNNTNNSSVVSGRKSWSGETIGKEQQQLQQQQDPLQSNHRMFPKTQPMPSHGPPQRTIRAQQPRPSPLMHTNNQTQAQEMPVQLSNIKKQWDVQRDIPSGTVKNNPFVPKPEPGQGPPPQLVHQKRQWDTSGIQRGSVASRAMSMEGNRANDAMSPSSRISPQIHQHQQLFDKGGTPQGKSQIHGLSSPSRPTPSPVPHPPNRRSFPFDNTSRAKSEVGTTETRKAPPGGNTALRGRLIENPFLPDNQETHNVPVHAPIHGTPSKWEPSKEIPVGAVKGKVNKLLSPKSNQGTNSNLNVEPRPAEPRRLHPKTSIPDIVTQQDDQQTFDDGSEDDPWIIPTKKSGPEAFPGNWGEAVPVKSSESDDWDSPATDWIKSSESQTTTSKLSENVYKDFRRNTNFKDPLNLGVLEEKKLNEDDSVAGQRDADILHWAMQKKLDDPAQIDPFGTTHARDAEILQAARQKTRQNVTTKSVKKEQKQDNSVLDVFDVFSSDLSAADQHGFPAEPFNEDIFAETPTKKNPLDFAFPASPFGGNSNFGNFTTTEIRQVDNKKVDNQRIDRMRYSHNRKVDAVWDQKTEKHHSTDQIPVWESKIEKQNTADRIRNATMSHSKEVVPVQYDDDYFMEASQEEQHDIPLPNPIQTPKVDRGHTPQVRDSVDFDDFAPKKQKKGFFNKIFGGGRKSRKSIGDEKSQFSQIPEPGISHDPPSHVEIMEGRERPKVDPEPPRDPPAQMMEVPRERHRPLIRDQPKPRESSHDAAIRYETRLHRGKSEDDTTVSEMTMPTIFKESSKSTMEARKIVAPILETVPSRGSTEIYNEEFHDPDLLEHSTSESNSEVELDNAVDDEKDEVNQLVKDILAEQSQDSCPPPPPPPPPRRLEEHRRTLKDADGIEKARLKSEMDAAATAVATLTTSSSSTSASTSSAVDVARFNRKMKNFKNTRHQTPVSKPTTKVDATPPPRTFAPTEKKVPNFVARHVKTKHAKVQPSTVEAIVNHVEVVQTSNIFTAGGGNLGKYERKFPKASKAFQHGKRSSATPLASSTLNLPANSVLHDRILSADRDVSVRSSRTTESASVGSDIRILRSILRRPRKDKEYAQTMTPKPVFASYDENNITDPMQRAGLRLLSAAIIPIQTEVRRFLAMRRALTRMWALIVIQSYARRWMAQRQYIKDLESIVLVQAVCRGHQQRNDLIYKHICAIEIQRYVRGYLSTMRVYEDIYKVTMVQSYVRMKLAMEEATNRMALVIQLQSVARGFLVRRRLEYQEACAVAIQANWRCFFTRLTYQFDLLDIIIVQSVWRRRMAVQEAKKRRHVISHNAATTIQAKMRSHRCRVEFLRYRSAVIIQAKMRCFIQRLKFLRHRSAVIIQTKWRSYDCTLNYLHYLADVLIVQSTVRRFFARRLVKRIKNESATKIQSVWRGFVCYADYMFTIADIVVTQKIARRWLAIKEAKQLRSRKQLKAAAVLQRSWRNFLYARRIQRAWRLKVFRRGREKAALTIQKRWRCFVDETEYVVMKYEYHAARTIQSYWRRFWYFSNFIIALDCTIQIQSTYRGYRQRMKFLSQKKAATTIQRHARSFLARKTLNYLERSRKIRTASDQLATLESYAAMLIQANYRATQVRVAVKAYLAARRIQAMVRGMQARNAVRLYTSSRKIQAMWRAKRMQKAYRYYCAARRIQSIWRCKRMYAAYKFYRAALRIQTRYRGMRARRDVLILRGEYLAASLIQSAWRGFVCYTDYIFTISDIISAQKIARRYIAQSKYSWQIQARISQRKKEESASISIQKVSRGFIARQRYWYTLGCTMQIQSWFRGRIVVRRLRQDTKACLTLQCFVRKCLARQEYLQRKFILALLKTAENERRDRVAATVIQQHYRTFVETRKRNYAAAVIQRFFLMVKEEVDDSRKCDHAARVIQRFFLMVKREVDYMVKATKRRKTWKKKTRNRGDNVEDALLEDAWVSAVNSSHNGFGSELSMTSRTNLHGYIQNENFVANVRRSHDYLPPLSRVGNQSKIDAQGQSLDWKHRLPPKYSDKSSSVIQLQDDDRSEFSGLTAATAPLNRLPVCRWKRRNSRELDEDLELEKAFIDAEIF